MKPSQTLLCLLTASRNICRAAGKKAAAEAADAALSAAKVPHLTAGQWLPAAIAARAMLEVHGEHALAGLIDAEIKRLSTDHLAPAALAVLLTACVGSIVNQCRIDQAAREIIEINALVLQDLTASMP